MTTLIRGAFCLSMAFALAGCDEQLKLTEAALDPSDSCSRFRADISEARRTEINQQIQGAAAGAAIGAFAGILTGDNSDERRRNAIIGATVGGLAGYSQAYLRQKQARATDANQLLASVNGDAAGEIRVVSQAGRAAVALRDCRLAAIRDVGRDIQAGRITGSDAQSRLTALKRSVRQDNQIISAAFNGIGERVTAYVDATNAVANSNSAISASRARSATPSVQRVSTQSRSVQSTDAQRLATIDAELDALEALVS